MEVWRPVVGFEGFYEVSSFGRVRSLDRTTSVNSRWGGQRLVRTKGKIIGWMCNGYPMAVLCLEGKGHRVFVHRLVCEAFNGPAPTEAHQVAHNDGVPTNNHHSNVRWATCAENMADKERHGTAPIGERHPQAKLTLEDAKQIALSVGRLSPVAKQFGVSEATICGIRKGRFWNKALAGEAVL